MNNRTNPKPVPGSFDRGVFSPNTATFIRGLPKLALAGAMLLAWLASSCPVWAQVIEFRTAQFRVTVPVNSSGSTIITNLAVVRTNRCTVLDDTLTNWVIGAINLNVTGLPSGATYRITDPNSVDVSSFTKVIDTNSASSSTNLWLWVNTTNVPAGTYTISLNATGGATNNLLIILQSACIWNGSTNAVLDGAGSWSDSTKWLSNAVPVPANEVVFTDLGGQTNWWSTVVTNITATSTNYTTNALINCIIGDDTTISSLRFAQGSVTNAPGNTRYHTIQINGGKKLTITGTNGLSCMRDYVAQIAAQGTGLNVAFFGTNGAALIFSNYNANLALQYDNQQAGAFDMTCLDNFAAYVNVIGLSDSYVYPNYWNIQTNIGTTGLPNKGVTSLILARTNFITATFQDPYDYENVSDREYGLYFYETLFASGSSTVPNVYLGISNLFYVNSVLAGGAAQRANLQFNTAFRYSNCVAIFRGTNGDRMTMFCEADGGGGPFGTTGNQKSTVDFSLGTLDMKVDRFYVGRDRPIIIAGATPNYQGFFFMGKGIIDANTMILGYRQYPGNPTNSWANYNGYCEGKLVIVSNGTVKVNGNVTLGYTTETNSNGQGSSGNTDWGQIYVYNGATMMASNIWVGGTNVFTSHNNFIVVSNNSSLIVSNGIASTNQMLDNFTLRNGATLKLHIDGASRTNAYVYATLLTMPTGESNIIRIASIKNLSYPATVPLIYRQSGDNGAGVSLIIDGGGVTGYLSPDAAPGTINVHLSTTVPKNLVWHGYVNGNWDHVTTNWQDSGTLLATNFADGDSVTFNDSNSPVNINVTDTVGPGGITLSNQLAYYTFSGSGAINNSCTLTKTGTNTLEIDVDTQVAVQLNQGKLTGNGSGGIGSATVTAGTTMNFAGSIYSGITCAGTATASGIVNGTLAVQEGGMLTNLGTAYATFLLQPGALLYNSGSMYDVGSPTVTSNATLINANYIRGTALTVNGKLIDTGAGSIRLSGTLIISAPPSGTNGNSGIFVIAGGDPNSTTTINHSGTATYPGRVQLGSFSTNIFYVNADTPRSAKLLGNYIDYGNNQTLTGGGAVIVITNIGATQIQAGQVYQLFGQVDGGQLSEAGTNTFPVIEPPAPRPGLAWDLSDLKLHGNIGVIATSTNTMTNWVCSAISFPTVVYTNYVTNLSGVITDTNYTTNHFVAQQFDWPSNYKGWRLQAQTNRTLSVGLSTNWVNVYGATWTNTKSYTNVFVTNTASFFRMIYP